MFAVGFLGCATLLPKLTIAHAIVVDARPAMNAEVARGQLDIRLAFNSRIDVRRSRLALRRPDGTREDVDPLVQAPSNALVARARASVPGLWKIEWQVLSVDGHITRGELKFRVR